MKGKFEATPKQPVFQPEWMTFEVHEALARIQGEHVGKKVRTVLHLAGAIAAETPQKAVFQRRDTCNRVTWYGRDGEPGWRDDPAIAEALRVATERALWWMRVRQGGAVQSALDVLVDASDAAARQLVSVATKGFVTVEIDSERKIRYADIKDMIKAADSILDRVSESTAGKRPKDNITVKLTWGEAESDG